VGLLRRLLDSFQLTPSFAELRATIVAPVASYPRERVVAQLKAHAFVAPTDRAELERLEAELALAVGGADDDDARGAHLRQGLEHADAVEVGHDQIEGHDVGLELGDLLEGVEAVAGDADDEDARAGAEDLAQHLARKGGVVDDQDPD